MDKKLKAKWVKALESGKFKQAKGTLKRVHGEDSAYCCLGVLREICPQVYIGEKREPKLLPLDAIKRIGMRESQQGRLAEMNDQGRSFKQIAKWIRAHL